MTEAESYQDIYNRIAAASKPFGVNHTTLKIVRNELEGRKIKKVKGSLVKWAREYNKTLEKLYETCLKQSEAGNEAGKLHLIFLKTYIDIMIKNSI